MSYRFDSGSSERITYGNVTFTEGVTRISGHCWVKIDDLSADRGLFNDGSDLTTGFMLFMDLSGVGSNVAYSIFTATAGGAEQIRVESPTDSAIARQWQSVGFTWNLGGNTDEFLRLYLDGREVANSPVDTSPQAATTPATPNLMKIGAGDLDANRLMDGNVAAVAIWVGRTLTAFDFRELAYGATPDDEWFQNDLKFYAPLDGHTQDVVKFLVGTRVGTPQQAQHPPNVPRFSPRQRITILAPQAVAGLTAAQMLPATQLYNNPPPGWDVEYTPVAV